MWGYRPYDVNIAPRENKLVSIGVAGEGFHNYHHTFPWDYSTSEGGWSICFNLSTAFLDLAALLGWVYDRKKVSPE
ncbi:acyl-CoA desaturase-like isoform X2, partial [Dinothrombium tinctorium]